MWNCTVIDDKKNETKNMVIYKNYLFYKIVKKYKHSHLTKVVY